MVKRGNRKSKNKLASARAKGKSKARARAAARALAKAKPDPNYVEPRSLFDESESESESDIESVAEKENKYLYPGVKLWTLYGLKEVIISEDGTPINVPTSLEPVDLNYKGYTFMEI